MSDSSRVIVVGSGLAGLTTARHLAAGGVEVSCLERCEAVGGRVRTTTSDGFTHDRGFQVLFTAYPAVRRELDLEALDLRRFAPGAVLARAGHRSTLADPLRDVAALPATLSNTDVTIGDKLRVLRLRLSLSRTPLEYESVFETGGEDETIETYLRNRGFSERFIENFAAPFYGGITLDRSLSSSKRLFEYTFRALSSGAIAVPVDGMGAVTAQLATKAREAGATIETETTVTAVDDDGVMTADGETRAVDAVVVATDPRTARELTGVESIPIEGRACVTQYYSLSDDVDLKTGGRLVLNAESAEPNHVVPHSAVAPEQAPDDAELLSATYLGERSESDAELADRTRRALESWYPEADFDLLEPIRTDRIAFAQFAQPPGVYGTLPDTTAPAGNTYLAGEYTRWSSIQGAIESGREAAREVVRGLE